MFYYSKQTGGFYSREINGDNIPSDAVAITPEQHAALLQVQSEGKQITADENGFPVLADPPPAPPYVPQQVTRAQGKAALIMEGLWDDVLAYVDSITDPQEKALALVALNDTTHWQRTSPFLNGAATALSLSSEDLDNLFIQASGIQL
ncbi:hypothetical protein [Methylobacillus sp.]|uniref:hypothetical protein n=1 Tax=Methylobacillus sp. TaxID=56818 RepID=UPI002FE27CE3